MSIILKVADLGHCARDLPCHFKWVQNLTEEFYMQGDAERSLNYPSSSQNDRKLWMFSLTKDRRKGLPRSVASEQVIHLFFIYLKNQQSYRRLTSIFLEIR